MRSRSFAPLCGLGTLALALSACGGAAPVAPSAPKALYEIAPENLDRASMAAFVAHAGALAAPDADRGRFGIEEMLTGVPMPETERERVKAGWPDGLAVTCAAGLCSAAGSGEAMEAMTNVVMGIIRNPKIILQGTVSFDYVMRGEHALEICAMRGVTVRKAIFSVPVRGLKIDVSNDSARATVDGDQGDAPAFDCAAK